jgi:nitrate/TMAO reductase-like tetraheme cytochrome c subunit
MGATSAKFKFDDLTCKGCHKDAHEGQLDLWIAKGGCEFCHNTDTWHRTSFDHKLARFPLEGKHREIICLKCHKVVKQDGKDVMWMKPLSMDCASCHADPHQEQFVRTERGEKQADCKRCHTSQGWNQLVFVHNQDARFKLDGAHEKVTCAACHPAAKSADGAAYVVYRPLQSECSACHAGKREG